jgi:polyisoprenoid-binding protein YceI
MRKLLLALPLLLAVPLLAQMPTEAPGKAEPKSISGGAYTVDTHHTLVEWSVNHMGFNDYFGLFGGISGTLKLDPAKPEAAAVSIDIPISGLTTTNAKLNEHLLGGDFFNLAQFATAKFVSTGVMVDGTTAMIHGDLTLHGVTKPVTLAAKFTGVGKGVMDDKENVGFHATTTIKRSDFGMGAFVPLVSDAVELKITAAFEKPAAAPASK